MGYFTQEWQGNEYFKDISFHHIEFYVGNAKQASFFYRKAFGFEEIAYSGPETGIRDRVSYVIKKNNIYFVFTTPLLTSHRATKWISKHGDAVYNIAFQVKDVKKAYQGCIERGAMSLDEGLIYIDDDNGKFTRASIKSYGDCIHTFFNNDNYNLWAPNFCKLNVDNRESDTNLIVIDHVVANVEIDKMDYWKKYYEKIFGFMTFVRFDETDISTKYSALKSIVVRSKNWKVKLPINEPAEGLKKSQIEEYLDFHNGPGVQHIALLSDNILDSICQLRNNGVEFLKLPDTYYDLLKEKNIKFAENIERLKELGILVDSDEQGYLLQLFTMPMQDRPTLFIEIIQRKGSQGFGQGNFQSLFESIELEQERRGNLERR